MGGAGDLKIVLVFLPWQVDYIKAMQVGTVHLMTGTKFTLAFQFLVHVHYTLKISLYTRNKMQ